jgi:hypothetical protein
MGAKCLTILTLKVIALGIILTVCFMVASTIAGISAPGASSAVPAQASHAEPAATDAGAVLLALLVTSLLEAAVLSYIILRSRWSGWKLVGAIFLAFYGLNTVISQIESLVYLTTHLPQGMVPRLFLMGVFIAGPFSLLAVPILGKMRRKDTPQEPNLRLVMPAWEWVWKLAAIAVAYEILYYGFGYFVAWRNPAVQAYYGGTDPGSFFAQIASIWRTTPWMFVFQAFRAMLWTAFTLPVIRLLKGRQWEVALAVALLFGVWSSQLLLPNPYMPEAVARTHLIETLACNLTFGAVVGWLLSRHHSSLRDLVRWSGVASA